MDYISREDAIEAITKTARKKFTLADWYEFYLKGMTDAEDSLKALPAADVLERNALQHAQRVESVENALDVPERNVGNWLPYEFGDYHWHKCSVCGKADKYIDTVIRGNGAEHDLTAVRNFCPNCGAKMEG